MVVYLLNSMKIFLSYSEIHEIDLRLRKRQEFFFNSRIFT